MNSSTRVYRRSTSQIQIYRVQIQISSQRQTLYTGTCSRSRSTRIHPGAEFSICLFWNECRNKGFYTDLTDEISIGSYTVRSKQYAERGLKQAYQICLLLVCTDGAVATISACSTGNLHVLSSLPIARVPYVNMIKRLCRKLLQSTFSTHRLQIYSLDLDQIQIYMYRYMQICTCTRMTSRESISLRTYRPVSK